MTMASQPNIVIQIHHRVLRNSSADEASQRWPSICGSTITHDISAMSMVTSNCVATKPRNCPAHVCSRSRAPAGTR